MKHTHAKNRLWLPNMIHKSKNEAKISHLPILCKHKMNENKLKNLQAQIEKGDNPV